MLVLPMTALAADETAHIDAPVVDYVENEITVKGSFASDALTGRLATLVVINPDKSLADFATDGVVAWADQYALESDGSFEFVIDMTYASSGEGYGVYVTASGADGVLLNTTFNYAKGEIDTALTEVLNDIELKAAMDKFIRETAAHALTEIDDDLVDDYIDLEHETKVADKMLDYIPYDDMDEFADKLRDAVDAQEKAERKASNGGTGGGKINIVVDPDLIVDEKADVNPFYDIADDYWGKASILYLYQKDIVAGQGDGYFRPDDTVTRAEFVQMVVKAFGFGMKGEEAKFEDVTSADWFSKAVQIAYSNGVVNGTSATTFSPNSNITRQDMMTILANAAKAVGKTLTSGSTAFTDAGDIASYAQSAVAEMVGSGVVSGYTDGSVKPLNNASRAEAAAMLARLLELK